MIYTFYSFKGGVGRSMALANVAELLCAHGLDVLVIDFDLEAPGLERFFEVADALTSHADIVRSRGVVDLILSYKTLRSFGAELNEESDEALEASEKAATNETAYAMRDERPAASAASAATGPITSEPLSNFIVPIYAREGAGHLWLMPAGRRDEDEYALYADRVASLDLLDLYTNWGGQEFFDWFIEEVNNFAPVVLIDSRTGITEMSGVCTHHLADAVALMVAPNEQNIDGIKRIIRSLEQPDLVRKARRDRPLSLLLVPSRVEPSEGDKLDAFAARFDKELRQHIDSRLVFERGAFVDLRIPYVPHYAYVETVAAREADSPKAADLVAAYNRVTLALIELADKQGSVYHTYHSQEAAASQQIMSAFPRTPLDFVVREWVLDRVFSWLRESKGQTFIVSGAPGSGKTALMAYFVENGFERDTPGARSRTRVVFALSCESGRSDALVFIADLARALASAYPAYLQHLSQITRSEPEISLRFLQRIGASSGSVQQAPRALQSIDLGKLSAATAFSLVVSRPLFAMFEWGHNIAIIVDGLDVEETRDNGILPLLMSAANGGLPPSVRLILSTRKDARIIRAFPGERVDLIEDAPDAVNDTFDYLLRKFERLPGAEPVAMANALAKTASGNFLVAKLLIETLADASSTPQLWLKIDRLVGESGLVPPLREFYTVEIGSLVTANPELWRTVYRPLLTTLAAARERLRLQQLAGILKLTRSELADALRGVARFVAGDLAEGPFTLVHASLAAFFMSDPETGVELGEIHEQIAEFFIAEFQDAWNRVSDPYPVRYTVWHLLSALRLAEQRRRKRDLSDKIVALLFDYDYLEARLKLGGVLELIGEAEGTLKLAEPDDRMEDLVLLKQFLQAKTDSLRLWDPSQDPNKFLQLVTELQGSVPRLQPPRERYTQAEVQAEKLVEDRGQQLNSFERMRETLPGAKLGAGPLRLADMPDLPPSMLAALRRFQEARSFGAIWLMLSIMLCLTTVTVIAVAHAFSIPPEVMRSLYLLTFIGGTWNMYVIAMHRQHYDSAVAQSPAETEYSESSRAAIAELEVLRERRYYRLVGSLVIVSPFVEATTILYIATFVVMGVSPITRLFMYWP